jgi:hypothetical protein
MESRLQIKCMNDEGRVHIQGISKDVQMGRDYGIAVKMRTTPAVSMWLNEQEACLKSAASDSVMYIPFRIYRYSNSVCQMFIPSTDIANHPNGAVMNLHPMSKSIQSLLVFADKAGLIEETKGTPYITRGEEE